MFTKFDVDLRYLPVMFLVNNTVGSLKSYEKFDEAALKRYMQADSKEINNNISFEQIDTEDEDHLAEELKTTSDHRQKFAKMIRLFMKHAKLVPHDDLKRLQTDMNAAKEHNKEVKKQDVKEYLQE
jgi:hypothetical protein